MDDMEAAARRDEEFLFRLFAGKRADKFMAAFRNSGATVNVAASLIPFPWLLYRKMWLWGLALFLVPVLLAQFSPQYLRFTWIGVTAALAMGGNPLYVHHARRVIRRLEALDLPEAERHARIAKAGGTSLAGMVVGLVLMALTLAAIIVAGNVNGR